MEAGPQHDLFKNKNTHISGTNNTGDFYGGDAFGVDYIGISDLDSRLAMVYSFRLVVVDVSWYTDTASIGADLAFVDNARTCKE